MHRFMSALSSAVVLLALALPVHGQDLQKGLDAANRGDYATALREWRPLADAGDAEAPLHLGFLYGRGAGVPQDDAEAVRWYRLAAERGNAAGQSVLGIMYAQGTGVAQDDAEAVRWFRLAAEQGYAQAQFMLAGMYAKGKGVLQDSVLTLMWLNLAAAGGNKAAATARDVVAGGLTPADIAEARRLAREWQEAHQ